jgi:uncharacterized membrane protein
MRRLIKIALFLITAYMIYELYSTIFNKSILAFGLFAFLLFLCVLILDPMRRKNAR